MDIVLCLKKIYPDWNGVVWNNTYDGIKPNATETRPIPTLKALEAVWPTVQKDALDKATALENEKTEKESTISTILPSWESVSSSIQNTKSIDELKLIVTDLAKIIYITVKGVV